MLTRRDLIKATGALGTGVLLGVFPKDAFACDAVDMNEADVPDLTSDETLAKWDEIMEKAKSEGAEIVTISNPSTQIAPRSADTISAYTNYSTVYGSPLVLFYCSYDRTTNSSGVYIFNKVYSVGANAGNGNSYVKVNSVSYTIIDGRRTCSAKYSLTVGSGNGTRWTVTAVVEYYASTRTAYIY